MQRRGWPAINVDSDVNDRVNSYCGSTTHLTMVHLPLRLCGSVNNILSGAFASHFHRFNTYFNTVLRVNHSLNGAFASIESIVIAGQPLP